MIRVLYLVIILATISCEGSKTVDQNDSPKEEVKRPKSKTAPAPNPYPFGEDLSSYTLLKSKNKEAEGDCWGNSSLYTNHKYKLYVDSTQCSEYNNQVACYMAKGDSLLFYYLIRAEANMEEDAAGNYQLMELNANFQEQKSWYRKAATGNIELTIVDDHYQEQEVDFKEIKTHFEELKSTLN